MTGLHHHRDNTMPTTRYGAPVQLELPLFGGRSLADAVTAYLARMTDDLAEATLIDYQERAKWCLRELGETTPIEEVTYDRLDQLWRRFRGVLRNVTVKKRLVFLRACLKFAETRGLLDKVPALPRMKNDGEARTALHTVDQWQAFREFLPPGAFRDFYDLGFWTGHHTADLFTMTRWMLDPDLPVLDENGREIARGQFWRRNQKNRRCAPCWVPMQPEFRLVAKDILARLPDLRDQLIVGRLWNVRRTLHMAADRATASGYEIPRCSPIDLRRSMASMLIARDLPAQLVRIILGHEASDSRIQGGESTRPTTADRHYFRGTPELMSHAIRVRAPL